MAVDLVELRMNVAALKRVDPYVKDILSTATQVALYTFNNDKNEWEKTDVEGALFLCSRNGDPLNSILIMNRMNTNNLVEPIVRKFDWQMQAPFLLYRNSNNKIYGIWFYNIDECVKITHLLENVIETLTTNTEDTESVKSSAESSNGGNNLFSLLNKAQENFNKTPEQKKFQVKVSTPRTPDVTPQSVMDFFAKASTTKTQTTPARSKANETEPLLHRLMSNPVHSVEHIEKQQRAVTPQEKSNNKTDIPVQEQPNTVNGINNISPFNSMNKLSSLTDLLKNETFETPINIETIEQPSNNTSLLESNLDFMRISSSPTSPKLLFFPKPEICKVGSLIPSLEKPPKPTLMPPNMFTKVKDKLPDIPQFTNIEPFLNEVPQVQEFVPEPLSAKQLVQAMIYLLNTDSEFVNQIHEAYINSLSIKR